MTFSMTGKIDGKPFVVGWRDGRLSGKFEGNEFFQKILAAYEGVPVQGYPTGPITRKDHVKNPFSTFAIFRSIVDGGEVEFGGSRPQVKPLPDGVLA